jgi:autotransporter adhesin
VGGFGTAVGFNTLTAFAGTAIGTDASAAGESSAAVGRFSNASGAKSAAFGHNSVASANVSVAIGMGARATAGQAIALGYASLADVANTVSVGSASRKRRIMNVAPGVAANDAVTVAQLNAAVAGLGPAQAAAVPIVAPDYAGIIEELRREVTELRARLSRLEQVTESLASAAPVNR